MTVVRPPRDPIQTSTQLGVPNALLLWRGLRTHCPACNHPSTHASWFQLLDRCPNCQLRFDRIDGHEIGYIGLNTIVTFAATFATLLGGALLTRPDIPVLPLIGVCLIPALLLPLLFTPSSHTLWTAMDMIMRPLRPGEIDPRFVEVDPETGEGRPRPR